MAQQNEPLFKWRDTYQLGILTFDEHHQKLVQLLNASFDAFLANSHPQTVAKILDELSDYARYHFSAEESWMAQQNYPALVEHTAQHNAFTAKLAEFQQARADIQAGLNADLFSFLADWLAIHILESDAVFKVFLKNHSEHVLNDSSTFIQTNTASK